MKFDSALAAIHGYLCADGYVIKNPQKQNHKYYHIGLRNTNMKLLKDFQIKFYSRFRIMPHITKDGRCRIQSKAIYYILTKDFSYYTDTWELPSLSTENMKVWLRSFFDCEAWVECQKAKSRTVRFDCKNIRGVYQIKDALEKFSVKASIKNRKNRLVRLNICGLENLKNLKKYIGFLHPDKRAMLERAINSYVDYNWKIPESKADLLRFVDYRGRLRAGRNEIRLNTIKKKNLLRLKRALNRFGINSNIHGPWINGNESKYYCMTIKKEVLCHCQKKPNRCQKRSGKYPLVSSPACL